MTGAADSGQTAIDLTSVSSGVYAVQVGRQGFYSYKIIDKLQTTKKTDPQEKGSVFLWSKLLSTEGGLIVLVKHLVVN